MKSARPIEDKAGAPGPGPAIVASAVLPVKQATVTSEVLARLLSGERLTSLDAVFGASTTRLSAVVEYLEKRYGWRVERANRAVGCRDGRVACVSEYFLLDEGIACALRGGGAQWCAEVKSARSELRTRAALARIAAQRANAVGQTCSQSGEWSLFEGDGVAG